MSPTEEIAVAARPQVAHLSDFTSCFVHTCVRGLGRREASSWRSCSGEGGWLEGGSVAGEGGWLEGDSVAGEGDSVEEDDGTREDPDEKARRVMGTAAGVANGAYEE